MTFFEGDLLSGSFFVDVLAGYFGRVVSADGDRRENLALDFVPKLDNVRLALGWEAADYREQLLLDYLRDHLQLVLEESAGEDFAGGVVISVEGVLENDVLAGQYRENPTQITRLR